MTKAEKSERHRVKHDLIRTVENNHWREGLWRFYARPAQMKAAAKQVAEQLLAGRNPAQAKLLQDYIKSER